MKLKHPRLSNSCKTSEQIFLTPTVISNIYIIHVFVAFEVLGTDVLCGIAVHLTQVQCITLHIFNDQDKVTTNLMTATAADFDAFMDLKVLMGKQHLALTSAMVFV